MATLERAIRIAVKAHKGQTDKYNNPYILHVLRVMGNCILEEEKIVAALHDVVEDTSWTLEQLKEEGFSPRILAALECVTKRNESEDYDALIDRIRKNNLAMRVKLADLKDNMDITRTKELSDKDLKRLNKYLRAWHLITGDLST